MERTSYPGSKIRLTFRGAVRTRFMDVNFTHKIDYNERYFLGSDAMRRSRKGQDLDIELNFENSADLNSAGLLAGTPVESFELAAIDPNGDVPALDPAVFETFPPSEWEISELGVKFESDKDSTVSVKIAVNVDDRAPAI